MKFTCGYITDRGLNPKRTRNEDNLLVLSERGLYLVADGVGGRRAGQTASQTVVDVFQRVFSQDLVEDLGAVLLSTIDLCNQKIYEDSQSNPDLEGMATTIAAVAVEGRRAVVVHVGDSRVYRFDAQGLIGLTEDHSEVNDALRSGRITEEEAAVHPKRNVINRALGAEPEVEPDQVEIELDDATSLLLCTDGITRHISDEEIEELLRSGRHPQTICETMKERCHARGAEDNLTVILVDFGERIYEDEPTRPARPARAEKAEAAAPSGIPIPRPASRVIEVDLTSIQTGAAADAETETGVPPTAPSGTPLPQTASTVKTKVELSRFMKWSLLLISLMIGLILGVLVGRPIADRFQSLFGPRTIYDQARIEQPPRDAEVNAAFARHLEGKTDEARQRLNQVLIANPNHAEASFYLGLIDYDQGKFDEAVNRLQQAAKLDPRLPNVQVRLAMAYLSIGQMRTARDVLQQMVAPTSPVPTPTPSATPTPK